MNFVSFRKSLSPVKKIFIVLSATGIYFALFFLLYPWVGPISAGLGLLPVIAAGLLCGKRGTIISFCGVAITNLVLMKLNHYDFSTPLSRERIAIGYLFIFISALVVGWTSSLLHRLQQQNEILGKKHKLLLEEIEKREESELNLRKQQDFNESLLQKLALLSTSRDQRSVLYGILNQIKKSIKCDSVSLFLVEDNALVLHANVSPTDKEKLAGVKFPISSESRNPGVNVYHDKKPIAIDDATNHPGWLHISSLPEIKTWLGVPLLLNDKAIGIIGMDRFTFEPFTENEIQLLQAFSRPIVLTIENQRLYQKAQQEIEEHKYTTERLQKRLQSTSLINAFITQLLNTDIADFQTNIIKILGQIGQYADADRCYLNMFGADKSTLVHDFLWTNEHAQPRKPNDQLKNIRDLPWVYERLSRFEIIHIPDISKLGPDASMLRTRWENFGIKSLLLIPIVRYDELIGILGFHAESKIADWEQEDIIALQLMANIFSSFWARRTAEKDQQDKLLFVESLLNAISTPLFSIDTKGHYLSCNHAFCDIYGVESENILGKSAYDFNTKERAEEYLFADFSIMEKGEAVSFEEPATYSDGSKHILMVHKAPFFDIEGNTAGLIAILVDLTEQKELEKALEDERSSLTEKVRIQTMELQNANDELERAVKAKDEFLAAMSHELRTPLNAILGLSEALQEKIYGPLTSRQEKSLTRIQESGSHLLALINDILDLAKIGANHMQLDIAPIDASYICNASVNIIREMAAQKQLTINMILDPEVKIIFADGRRLKQILLNLLSNAVKFTPENGVITLEMQGDTDNKWVHFHIRDNGIGIAEQDLPSLFTPFQQVDSSLSRKYEGAGLGLALAAQMVRLHSGAITVESKLNEGSHFCVSLPWDRVKIKSKIGSAEPKKTVGHSSPSNSTTANQTILIAEDNLANAETLTDYLHAKGYRTINAVNGKQAIELARTEFPDMILMDIQMPEMNGIEAIQYIRREPNMSKIPIIAITAHAMPDDKEKCLSAGANEYLVKPIQMNTLLETMQFYLWEKSPS